MTRLRMFLYGIGIATVLCGILALQSHNSANSSIVKIGSLTQEGGGTGFAVRSLKGNVIVTNAHVCAIATGNQVLIEEQNGKRSIKNILARNVPRDLCVIEGVKIPALPLSKTPLHQFDEITVLGHPFLNPLTRSKGEYVADTIAPIGLQTEKDGTCKYGTAIQSLFGDFCVVEMELSFTTVPIYPGNSGSPVLNSGGEVVGVINAAGPGDRGLFVPLPYLEEMLEQN